MIGNIMISRLRSIGIEELRNLGIEGLMDKINKSKR
jgi:hypothetical protein